MTKKTFSRDDVAEWAGLTRHQLNHMHKIGLCVSDVGEFRKRISKQEAVITACAAAFMRAGVAPASLVEPFKFLRESLRDDTLTARLWAFAVDDLPVDHFSDTKIPDELSVSVDNKFFIAIYADETEWQASLGNSPTTIDTKESCIVVEVAKVLSNRGELGDT